MQRRAWLCQTLTGATVPACSITVYVSGTTTKATIYSDQAGSSALANPISAGTDGTYTYYAPSGRYTEVVTAPGFTFGAAQTQDFILHDPFAAPGVSPNIFATTTWLNATPNCTNVTPATTGQTWCFDQTHRALKVWNGTTWATTTLSNVGASGFGGLFSLANCATIVSPITGQSFCLDQTANKLKVWNGATWVQPPTDVLNVRDFGAVDDGTTDNCNGTGSLNFFQNAINAATATTTNGGIVYIPTASTRWLCSAGVQVFLGGAATPLAIVGDGKWASVIRYSGAGSWLTAAGGNISGQIRLENFTVQLTNTAATALNLSQFQSSTVRSVRTAWSGAGAQGGTGVSANPQSASGAPFYNVLDDLTFDSVASGIVLNTQVGQAPNRWRILAPTFLAPNAANTVSGIVIGNGSTNLIAGTDIVAPYCDQIGGTCVWLGGNSDRTTIVAARLETAQGGSLWGLSPSANRTTILGYGVHAGTIGSTASGLRNLVLGAWDDVHVGNSVNGAANLFDVNTSGANGGVTLGGPTGGDKGVGTLNIGATLWMNGSQMLTASPAITLGAVTGGDKGAGTINASAYYVHGTAIASMPLTNASGTVTNAPHIVQDTVTLSGGTAGVALAGAAAFTNATSYTCVADDDTAIAAVKIVQNGGNGFTVLGTGSDVVRFLCVGN